MRHYIEINQVHFSQIFGLTEKCVQKNNCITIIGRFSLWLNLTCQFNGNG